MGIVLLLISCATTTQYVKQSNDQSENTAKIYVIRPTVFGSGVKTKTYQNDQLIGKLGPKSYLAWEVDCDKGDINIISKSENKDTLTINPIAGESYFIRQKIKMGFVIARTKLEFIDENEAKEYLKEIKRPNMEYAD